MIPIGYMVYNDNKWCEVTRRQLIHVQYPTAKPTITESQEFKSVVRRKLTQLKEEIKKLKEAL